MRIWSLHPRYLDAKGLVAVWREALLAQAVLRGKTKGYTNHPQLTRFRELSSPVGLIGKYLRGVHVESVLRGYQFSASRITNAQAKGRIVVTTGQLEFEFEHLMRKLQQRDPERLRLFRKLKAIDPHPLFFVVDGPRADWEKG